MLLFRPLPWEYGIRNLFRRWVRTGLTLVALTIVVLMVFVVVGFLQGLEHSLAAAGDPDVAIIFSLGMGENLEYSSVAARAAEEVPANLQGVRRRFGLKYVSPELYLGSLVRVGGRGEPVMGLVRGVTPGAALVHNKLAVVEGRWPDVGEVLVGRLAATKLGVAGGELSVGRTVEFEGRRWKVAGVFAAGGSVFESEMWCRLDDLQQAMKRTDLSLVAVRLEPGADFADVELFCKGRQDLELQAVRQSDYFASLEEHYRPVRALGWFLVVLVSAGGAFAGLNTMYGAALGRVRELATLQTVGFSRRAILLSLLQEGALLAAAASLLAAALALALVQGTAVRFTMAAFELRVDGRALLVACGAGLLMGILGALLPAARVLRLSVVDGLREG